jgi:uncharacterized protein YjbJ (UPF0337 family)
MSSGTTDKAKGRVKEAVGALTDDDRLRRKGKADQAIGKVKDTAEKVVDKEKNLWKTTEGAAMHKSYTTAVHSLQRHCCWHRYPRRGGVLRIGLRHRPRHKFRQIIPDEMLAIATEIR